MISVAYAATLAPGWHRFERACRDPRRVQLARLRRFVERNAESAYGQKHGYRAIADPAAFQDRVPIVDYLELAPYIERIGRGEPNVLAPEPVRALERTSG